MGVLLTTIVVADAARGLAVVTEPSWLSERGGPATLSFPWAKSLLKCMKFTKRRVSTKCGNPSENIEDVRREFLEDIIEAIERGEIPDLISNWDQTGILSSVQ